jgi:ribonuclease E
VALQSADAEADPQGDNDEDDEETEGVVTQANGAEQLDENGEPRRRRRRGRRGGRRNRREGEPGYAATDGSVTETVAPMSDEGAERVAAAVLAQDAIASDAGLEPGISVIASDADTTTGDAEVVAEDKPKRARRSRKSPDADAVVQDAVVQDAAPAEGDSPARPKSRSRRAKAAPPTEAEAIQSAEAIAVAVQAPVSDPVPVVAEPAPKAAVEDTRSSRPRKELPEGIVVSSSAAPEGDEQKPKKAGWWQRGFFGG